MIYFSVCSRKDKKPKALQNLIKYCKRYSGIDIQVSYDASSIYEGHNQNISFFNDQKLIHDDDIIVLCHDDLEIVTNISDLLNYLNYARKPGVGFVGIAGGCHLPSDGAWWNSRNTGDARGFVFQGNDQQAMTPNYFGKSGQVVILDGCMMAITYGNLKTVGLDQPEYLETGWDFYDIHLTYTAHLAGFSNYVVPIVAMHESSGIMREGWFNARDKFMRKHVATIPYSKLPTNKTHGLP